MNKIEKHDEEEVLSKYLKVFRQHKKFLIWTIVLFVVFFPIISLWVMKGAAMVKGNCLYVPDNVNPWFGYSASYLGAVASLCIGLLTIELTLMLERINKNEQQKQQAYSIATNMPDLICINGILYDCDQDIPSGHLDKLTFFEGYILELCLKPAFPIYFEIKIKRIGFQWKALYVENHISKIKDEECWIELHKENYDFTNNDVFKLAVYFTIKNEHQSAFQNFYESYLSSSYDTNYKDSFIEVMIEMECKNVLLSNQEGMGDIPFQLCLTMKNTGKNNGQNGISLETINRKIRR